MHYAPVIECFMAHSAYSVAVLFKMLLVETWNGGLYDESMDDIVNSNLHVMSFMELSLEDDVSDHSMLS